MFEVWEFQSLVLDDESMYISESLNIELQGTSVSWGSNVLEMNVTILNLVPSQEKPELAKFLPFSTIQYPKMNFLTIDSSYKTKL